MRRVLSIWFPQLPLDRLARLGDPRLGGAFAVAREVKRSWWLANVNEAARESGLSPGLPLSDARAICPRLGDRARRHGAGRGAAALAGALGGFPFPAGRP